MGLDKAFLDMLDATVVLERAGVADQWGNEAFSAPESHAAFVDMGTSVLGSGVTGQYQDKKIVTRVTVTTDALGIAPGDRLTFGGKVRYVTEVETFQDEDGSDLYQQSTTEDQKRG